MKRAKQPVIDGKLFFFYRTVFELPQVLRDRAILEKKKTFLDVPSAALRLIDTLSFQ